MLKIKLYNRILTKVGNSAVKINVCIAEQVQVEQVVVKSELSLKAKLMMCKLS